MRILYYCRFYFPVIGGNAQNTRLLSLAFCAMGHPTTVWTGALGNGSWTPEDADAPIARRPQLSRLAQLIRKHDIIISRGSSARAYAWSLLLGKPCVTVHTGGTDGMKTSRGLRSRLGNATRRASLRYGAGHILITRAQKSFIEPLRYKVIYNPVDATYYSPVQSNYERRKFDILYVGRMLESKGIFVLLDAIEMCHRNGLRVRALFCGDGPALTALRSDVRRKKLDEYVAMPGVVMGPRLINAYDQSRIIVLAPTGPEGFGLTLAEGMARGLPAIVSDFATIREVVGNAGLDVKTGDAIALSIAVRKLLTDTQLYERLSREAQKRANAFRPERIAAEYVSYLEGCLRRWRKVI